MTQTWQPQSANCPFRDFTVDYISNRWPRDYVRYAVCPPPTPQVIHGWYAAMLTFVTYEVLKHPGVLLKLRTEIDEVLGDRQVSLEDLAKMPYTVAVMRETLRFRPPATTRSVFPKEATTIGNGKYPIGPGDTILVNVTQVHRDPEIWGDDVCSLGPFLSSLVGPDTFSRHIYSNPSGCWTGSLRHYR